MSAISSLLNIKRFRSRTVGLAACQLGSAVSTMLVEPLAGMQNDVELNAPGEPSGDEPKLEQFWVTSLSLCTLLCGGDWMDIEPLLFPVMTGTKISEDGLVVFLLGQWQLRSTVHPSLRKIGKICRNIFLVAFGERLFLWILCIRQRHSAAGKAGRMTRCGRKIAIASEMD
jgi:hypothetical protein